MQINLFKIFKESPPAIDIAFFFSNIILRKYLKNIYMRIDVEMCLKMVLFVSEITPKILHLLDEFHQMFRLSLFKISEIKK